jgi:hypothetical protein
VHTALEGKRARPVGGPERKVRGERIFPCAALARQPFAGALHVVPSVQTLKQSGAHYGLPLTNHRTDGEERGDQEGMVTVATIAKVRWGGVRSFVPSTGYVCGTTWSTGVPSLEQPLCDNARRPKRERIIHQRTFAELRPACGGLRFRAPLPVVVAFVRRLQIFSVE